MTRAVRPVATKPIDDVPTSSSVRSSTGVSRCSIYVAREWLLFVDMALGPGVFGHTVVNWTLAPVESNVVSASLLGEPVGGTLSAFVLLSETPTLWTVGGGAVVLLGIVVTARGGSDG